MAKIQDVDIPYLEFAEAAAPGTPAAGIVRIYSKTDGSMYQKDDAGTETGLAGAAGSVATDAIWDAAGDLVQGTGANTAARLALGSALNVLRVNAGATAVEWAAPAASFPTTAYAAQTADVSLTADTPADATGASVSLAAGTWLITAMITFRKTSGSAGYVIGWVTDGSNTVLASTRDFITAANLYATLPLVVQVTPGSTTTYKLRGQASHTNDEIERFSDGVVISTTISAIKTA